MEHRSDRSMDTSLLVANRFRIEDVERDLLGRGGMGEVYRATDIHSGESVAVKALNPEILEHDPSLLERFAREAEALRVLNHPNIVRVIAVAEEQGRHYLAMELVEGGSLQEMLSLRGCLPAGDVLRIALEVADALTRAHHLRIIHRDLKPANVLLARDGTPRLADFGLAHVQDSPQVTQSGMLIGTIDYMSPEGCHGAPPDERTDIWAFGIMLFEMLAGRVPFGGKNLTAKITAILTEPVPDLAALAPATPDGLLDLIYRMLEKDPPQRITSVRQVGLELEALLKGREPFTGRDTRKEGSRFATPPPTSDVPKHNLPAQATTFVGRQSEMTELARLLDSPDVRLITILGAGGMGKTRLALEAGTGLVDCAGTGHHFADGVYFVPALVGLGAPHWQPEARGTITGLTRGTTRAHLARAALEAMAYGTADVFDAMRDKSGVEFARLRVDGGAAVNDWLMQFQADVLGLEVERARMVETTAFGAAGLAGIAAGVWKNAADFLAVREYVKFRPAMTRENAASARAGWRRAAMPPAAALPPPGGCRREAGMGTARAATDEAGFSAAFCTECATGGGAGSSAGLRSAKGPALR